MGKTFRKPTEKDLEKLKDEMQEALDSQSFHGFQRWLACLNEAARVIGYLSVWCAEDFIKDVTGTTDCVRMAGMEATIRNQWDIIEKLREQVEELTPDIVRYENRLKNMDWYYTYSDDINVWKAGEASYKELQEWAKKSPEHQALFGKYRPK